MKAEIRKKYRKQINKHDPLIEAKRNAIDAVIWLEYPMETLDIIVAATKETDIIRALTNARKTA